MGAVAVSRSFYIIFKTVFIFFTYKNCNIGVAIGFKIYLLKIISQYTSNKYVSIKYIITKYTSFRYISNNFIDKVIIKLCKHG